MATRFSILLNEAPIFEAGSTKALANLLIEEERAWQTVIPTLRVDHGRIGYAFRAGYRSLIDAVATLSKDHPSIEIRGNNTYTLFPAYHSNPGKVLRSLLSRRGIDAAFLAYYSHENGWGDAMSGFTNYGLSHELAVGAALYLNADLKPSVFSESAEEITAAAQGAAEKRIAFEAQLSDFHGWLKQEEQQIQSSRSSLLTRAEEVKKLGDWLVRRYSKRTDEREAKWQEQFNATHEAYVAKLQFEAPAALWASSAASHRAKSRRAAFTFTGLMTLIIVCALVVAVCFGPTVAQMFKRQDCTGAASDCVPYLSPEGPLFIGALLLALSMGIWGLRMVNRIHLSERNLAQAAEEKKAFVETYLALIKDGQVTRDQESIVLGAIFRPSADGFVSDDSSSMDISAAAVLAKVLSGKS